MLSKNLSQNQKESLLKILEDRFERNLKRHPDMKWIEIKSRLEKMPEKLWALQQMEEQAASLMWWLTMKSLMNLFFVTAHLKVRLAEGVFAMTKKPWNPERNSNLSIVQLAWLMKWA
jgi:hypothetical protein